MIKKKPKQKGKITIDLTGPNGNAYYLMGNVQIWCNQLGIDPEPILEDMMSGDYEHLLSVIEKHFGDIVVMYR